MNKPDLIQKIKQHKGITLTPEEQSYLLDLINTKKKYGLVWEEKTEDVEEQLRTHLPVLSEVVEKRIKAKTSESGFAGLKDLQDSGKSEPGRNRLNDGQDFKKLQPLQPTLFEESENPVNSENQKNHQNQTNHNNQINHSSDIVEAPNHILIEGDNLHALTALSFTHEGMIDVIYIDPPYNTGNKDFKYNDSYVDKEDSYRHSKWLSFMDKRMRIAKQLLSNRGVIFISIDDNEQAHLKLICDEIFGVVNFMGNIIWQSRTSISNDDFISTNHNHTHIYAKNLLFVRFDGESIDHSEYNNPDNDLRGPWKLVPIDANKVGGDTVYAILNPKTGKEYYPPGKRIWAINRISYQSLFNDGRIKFGLNDDSAPKRKLFLYERLKKGDSKTPSSILLNAGTTKDGTNELIDILGIKNFDYPKPSSLIKRLLNYTTQFKTNSLILDFFAGSGTTLHATMQLNAEDGGNRQCILVTNNENKICEEVTYERNRRVIQGYTNSKGDWVPGLTNNNLRYYKTALVPSMRDEPNKRLLAQTSTDLLCIKEDCYTELTEPAGFNPAQCRIFTNEGGKYLMIVFHSRHQLEVYELLINYIKSLGKLSENIKLYAFSPEKETLLEDFAEIAESIDAVPLPEAIYNAYRATFRTLKLDKKPVQTTHDEKTGDADES